jgi:hypothetical protein
MSQVKSEMNIRTVLESIRPLTDHERIDARDRAKAAVIKATGDEPDRAAFMRYHASKYPRWLTGLIGAFLLIVFIAAFAMSLFRVFTAGRDYFLHGINIEWQAAIAGTATFILAEFLVIASMLAMSVYFKNRDRWLMLIPAGMGVGIALVGNWVVSQPEDLFGWMETLSPPLAVLFMAVIGERMILHTLRENRANELAYQDAVNAWKQATADPEKAPSFTQFYANALRAAIYDANARGQGKTRREEILSTMTAEHWKILVSREMRAGDWFELVEVPAADTPTPPVIVHTQEPQELADSIPFGNYHPGQAVSANGRMSANGNGHTTIATKTDEN